MATMNRTARNAGMGNLAIGLLVLLVIVPLALRANQPPAPLIAEFAPEARQQIKQAPSEQGGDIGQPGAGGGASVPSPSPLPSPSGQALRPSPSPALVRRPGAPTHRCVGNPPRQIEDPQSPPCVPAWDGTNNGGATSKGVTATTITIAVPSDSVALQDFENFFNDRFEFYGRKIHLVTVATTGTVDDPVTQQADAATVNNIPSVGPAFASSTYKDLGDTHYYYDALAKNYKIIGVGGRPSWSDAAHLAQFAPYEWSWLPGEDGMGQAKAAYACNSLVGKSAQWAAGTEKDKPRQLGVIVQESNQGQHPPIGPLLQALAACGVNNPPVAYASPPQHNQSLSTQAILAMKGHSPEVTTILCECNQVADNLREIAGGQAYFPEWVAGTFLFQDDDGPQSRGGQPSRQEEQTFGLTWWNKELAAPDMPWYWAAKEVDPSVSFTATDYLIIRTEYAPLLLLASGIQMAGPNLTPETFQQALWRTKFPNPGAGAAPYYQAYVGFPGQRHNEVGDASLVWWSDTQNSNFGDGAGTFCFARSGLRYGIGEVPFPTDGGGIFPSSGGPCY
ncbi:MAG: hypothetical protein ACYDGR_04305 [Candidatus Dormibacteria bacterium]